MKRTLVPRFAVAAAVLFAFAALALPLPSKAQPQRAEFMVNNRSDWDIYHMYLSPEQKDTWGEDQLGEHVIKSGESFTLNDIPCGEYDIKLVDEDGDACVVEGIVMCKDHTHWDLTNKELANCEGWGN
ncbi:MAG TPA: hypothetical protein VGC87_20150 [Pyrinomonadaceae bacterium]|jgi:hypothetical protein